jgi:hypothetical protein
MNKLKGAIRIYAFQDIWLTVTLILIFIGSNIIFGSDDFENGVFNLGKSSYRFMIPMMIVMDYGSSFSIRFLMQANFSRKLFYKANMIAIGFKTVLITLSLTMYVMVESFIYKYNKGTYNIVIFGEKSATIEIGNLLAIITICFSFTLFAYSFSFMIFSIEKFQIVLLMVSGTFEMIIFEFLLKFSLENFNNYILLVLALLSLALLSFFVSWQIIKRKSNLGNSWLVKLQMSMSSYSKN